MRWFGLYLFAASLADVVLLEVVWVQAVPALDQVEVDRMRPAKVGVQVSLLASAGLGALLWWCGR